jgi:hypothetical protein
MAEGGGGGGGSCVDVVAELQQRPASTFVLSKQHSRQCWFVFHPLASPQQLHGRYNAKKLQLPLQLSQAANGRGASAPAPTFVSMLLLLLGSEQFAIRSSCPSSAF